MTVNHINTSNINSGIHNGAQDFIKMSENIYQTRLSEAAEKIYADRATHPLVLLSGPSGSGKTTSALRIARLLADKGLTVHTVSMDNYFLPDGMGEMPLDEDGNPDLESPYRVDIPLFSDHLKKLFECEPVDMPVFDFATQSRVDSVPVHRKENEIIIIEGIHALNLEVTGNTDSFTTCIYVSVRTRIRTEDGSVMHPRKIRLMRRLNRDRLFRNRKFEDVFAMYDSVTRGEEKFIMPHKHRATFDIDSFIPYEASVYSKMLLPSLLAEKDKLSHIDDFDTMLKVMGELTPVTENLIPQNSLVREFVGGSSLNY
ncbi:MAG: nucleoside kinase [Oscillospiraceae bacterium]|nr:nucleoside kinase [Oscillospiraceae bacterium]